MVCLFDDDDSNISDANFTIDEDDMNREISAEEALDIADKFYNAWEDLDSDRERSEVDLDSDTEDLEVNDLEPVIEDPEVREINDQATEEVEEDFTD